MAGALTVFLCSTQAELGPEREAVLAAVRRLQLQHDAMEFFGAREGRPLETCLEEVRKSDILVVVIGHRYGTFVSGQKISYTEAEYQEGHRLGKPCLVYIRGDDIPVLPRHVERDPDGIRALERLKATLRERHTCAPFKAPDDLAIGVAADLSRTVQDLQEAARLQAERQAAQPRRVLDHLDDIVTSALKRGINEAALSAEIRRAVDRLARSEEKRQPLVFFSHTHTDKGRVGPFADAIRSHGLEVWMDEERISPGDSLLETISRGLRSAECLAFFMSQASVQSPWVRQELSIVMAERLSAHGKGPIVIPILLDDVDLPPVLRDVKYIDLRSGDVRQAAAEFSRALARHLEASPPPGAPEDNSHVVEKSIHSLRALLHVRRTYAEEANTAGSGRRSLEHAIKDLAKAVGGLCGLSKEPENRLQFFVDRVLAAHQGNDLPQIFRDMPELREFLKMPYFDMGDGAQSWVSWEKRPAT
jgi:hypothetical protein